MKRTLLPKKIRIHPLLAIMLIISLATNAFLIWKRHTPLPSPTSTTRQTVTSIIDGDTFDTGEGLRIRLALIDAPEYPKGCFSLQSKQRLSALILGKTIQVEEMKKDSFGRTVAFVFVNDLFVNKTIVTEGYASLPTDSDDTKYSHDLALAQQEAMTAQRGIWSSACQTDHKKECVIKGNYRPDTKTKIYHLPDCFNYEKISINTKEKDQWFCTETEAQNAGFIKSTDCP